MLLRADVSLSAVVAGFVTVLVGFTRSAVIVFQAARAAGANQAEISSWIWALGIGMGAKLLSIGSAFWGLLAGVLAWLILRSRRAG